MNGKSAVARKSCLRAELISIENISPGIFSMEFDWPGPAPRAGQFFMVKPSRSSQFLGRPISVSQWIVAAEPEYIKKKVGGKKNSYTRYKLSKHLNANSLYFVIALRGKGTTELAEMRPGEEAELTGPLGNSWANFLPLKGENNLALIGGGLGLAPLNAFAAELPEGSFDYYAGFKSRFKEPSKQAVFFEGAMENCRKLLFAYEDGSPGEGFHGRIPDAFDAAGYSAVFTCGPEVMMRAVAAKCKAAGVPCYMSLERRMACGTGACLGCTVSTVNGNRRCCADGPIFPAGEIIFDER
jgi:NAD(P)H-flavin reductase